MSILEDNLAKELENIAAKDAKIDLAEYLNREAKEMAKRNYKREIKAAGPGVPLPLSELDPADWIMVRGAREHNLKNIDVAIPRNKLTVITGVSGSGKSSLCFATIHAEGNRRYLETLSAYARQFLNTMEKPDVDSIDGLSPSIAIEQKTVSKNPRSTVATITEVYDYARVLWARIGKPHCPICDRSIDGQSSQQIVDQVMVLEEGTKISVNAPLVRGRKGEYKDLLEKIRGEGFQRVKVDGEVRNLEEDIVLDKKYKHDIDVVIDRIKLRHDDTHRLTESIETALELAEGLVKIDLLDKPVTGKNVGTTKTEELLFSSHFSCPVHGASLPELEPRVFSFNAPHGACPTCTGLGYEHRLDEDLLITDKSLSIDQGALASWQIYSGSNFYASVVEQVSKEFGIDTKKPWKDLDRKQQEILLHGPDKTWAHRFTYKNSSGRNRSWHMNFTGIIGFLESRYRSSSSNHYREKVEEFMTLQACPACKGARLKPEVLAVTVCDSSINAFTRFSIEDALIWVDKLELSETDWMIGRRIIKEIRERLGFLNDVGVGYLTLDRASSTLSGGEGQRIRLASSVGGQGALRGVIMCLDEPSIGLAPRDNDRLIKTLRALQEMGNTVIVVEHDEETQIHADYLIDIGPGAGEYGGEIIAAGKPTDVMKNPDSLTGQYLMGKRFIPIPTRRTAKTNSIKIKKASMNNLKNVTVDIPLQKFVCVTGVSGSGKSSLINDILYKGLANALGQERTKPGAHHSMIGTEWVDKVINIDQSPIGRTPRSNPVTYTKTFDIIRELLAQTPDARAKGYKQGRFSFNVKGGRCEVCQGDGVLTQEMLFLPDVEIVCDACNGSRFNDATLEVRYKGKNVAEILRMSVDEALAFFVNVPRIKRRLQALSDVGLGYIRLGQPATTLSGGEAQRVKLATHLMKANVGRTGTNVVGNKKSNLLILDEPSTGLHTHDVAKLLETLQTLADKGTSIVCIEHNTDIMKSADYLIDLGPEGGPGGGQIVATGTPEEIAKVKDSWTGQFLGPVIEQTKNNMTRAAKSK